MPGIVVRVLVEAGQRVEAGQELVVLEAMKMEHRICAPDAGLVTEVRVAVGQTVAAGMALVVLETHK
jgi:propionyl-CoA carboxylase alpha chain